ncbi:MAG TPA: winged helix-turn-helix domain-containing protein [Solirubrobacteraceae bacterium]|jgi:DNA-binding response OmpR family regulator|nr:winged helix-turn-helix domain-containing protein [Solirubrobacteraceae bacterium]
MSRAIPILLIESDSELGRAILERLDASVGLGATLAQPPVAPIPGEPAEAIIRVGALAIDPRARAVTLHGRPLELCRLEYELLAHLARDPRRVFSRHELLREVWGYRAPGRTRTLDTHASRLRAKLAGGADGLAGGGEHWIVCLRGVGYRLI